MARPRKAAGTARVISAGGLVVPGSEGPLIRLDPHQMVAFWSVLRTLFILWRRQAGKSYTLGAWALRRMMERANHLVVLCSASIALGKEWVLKEAQVWLQFTQAYRDLLTQQGTPERIITSADDDKGRLLDVDAVADLFEHQKLETRILHGHTSISRSMVVAPNPDTAVGWTGDVGVDECGRIDCLRELLEAVGPILSRNPNFLMRLATTISPDDTHFSREIHGLPAELTDFPVNKEGNLYVSKSGYTVHRFDAFDAAAAGLKLYDDKTGAEVTPEQHRAAALDKAAWDRNFWLKEVSGGTAAIPAGVRARCINEGRGHCDAVDITDSFGLSDIPSLFPTDWDSLLNPRGRKLAIGYDVATTTGEKSNPSSIALMQEVGLMAFARLVLRFKTEDPEVSWAFIEHILAVLQRLGLRARNLCIDATNERFHAVQTRKHFLGRLPVKLVISSETLEYGGETMTYKSYMGNRIVNAAGDGYLALPPYGWIDKDWSLVKMKNGLFVAEVDERGNHADTFDGVKLGYHGLCNAGGPAKAAPAGTTSTGGAPIPRPGIRHPSARQTSRPKLHV